MFNSSIDSKQLVTDTEGNQIVDLAQSPFLKSPLDLRNEYTIKRVPETYICRPDLIAKACFGSIEKTEYVMMFNCIGNPFAIDEDDILLIPNGAEADSIVIESRNDITSLSVYDASIQDILVKNYYKFSDNKDNVVDTKSYNDFLDDTLETGNPNSSSSTAKIPYLLDDDEEAMVYKNGRLYFNSPNNIGLTDSDLGSDDIDTKISNIIDGVSTDLSDTNCVYNGTNLSDFIKALNNTNQTLSSSTTTTES